jgi:Fe-S cluster biosynthesis and repair protein YggX
MNRSTLRKLIKECICEIIVEGTFDHMAEPAEGGRHPQHSHLVYYEFEPHYGSYIVTAPKTTDGDLLMSHEDVVHAFGEEAVDNEFAYGSDEYLDLLEPEVNENVICEYISSKLDNLDYKRQDLAAEVGKYLRKKVGSDNWPEVDDFKTILGSQRAMSLLSKYPLGKAAEKAAEMILAVSSSHLQEEKTKKVKGILLEVVKDLKK